MRRGKLVRLSRVDRSARSPGGLMSDPKPPREGTSREMLAEIQQLLSQLDSHAPMKRESEAAATSTPLPPHPQRQPEPRIDGRRTFEEIVSDVLRPLLQRCWTKTYLAWSNPG